MHNIIEISLFIKLHQSLTQTMKYIFRRKKILCVLHYSKRNANEMQRLSTALHSPYEKSSIMKNQWVCHENVS